MKKLFAAASYSFDSFYNNLNTQGQMVFSLIILLIAILCVMLFITYVIDSVKSKIKLKKIKEQTANIIKEDKREDVNKKNEIENIANAISDALKEDSPITLTNFEEDQERTAIISIDELMKKAKELELINDDYEDDNTGINYLEKYNLEPAEVEKVLPVSNNEEPKKEVKAFKVSQVISPIYGVKKEIINTDNK